MIMHLNERNSRETVHCTLCDWHSTIRESAPQKSELWQAMTCEECGAPMEFLEICSCVSYKNIAIAQAFTFAIWRLELAPAS